MYSDMKPEVREGGVPIRFVCRGFRNPIVPTEWPGFRITFYDSQFQDETNPSPNEIQTTDEQVTLNASNFEAAIIPSQGITISPTIFMIAESSVWTLSISDFPVPLQKECYVRLTVPPDLKHNNVVMFGTGMFSGQAST